MLTNTLIHSRKIGLVTVSFFILSNVVNVLASQSFSSAIQSSGVIRYISGRDNLRGFGWYGLDTSSPDSFRLNSAGVNRMIEQFPDTGLLVLPLSAWAASSSKISRLKELVALCASRGIKVIISNYQQNLDETSIRSYWVDMAHEFKGNDAVIGFDLINEPWAFAEGDSTIVQLYERLIDAIRNVDPSRTCYVQSYVEHHETLSWVRTNPVRRENVVYIHHLYSNWWTSGDWFTSSYTHPWSTYYINHDYENGRIVLEEGMYERFGFVKQELGLPIAITELAFLGNEEGRRYGADVMDILNEWNVDWAYHSYYSDQGNDRPMVITYENVSLKPQATEVRQAMQR